MFYWLHVSMLAFFSVRLGIIILPVTNLFLQFLFPAAASGASLTFAIILEEEFLFRLGILERSEEKEIIERRTRLGSALFTAANFLAWSSTCIVFYNTLTLTSPLLILALQILITAGLTLTIIYLNRRRSQ